MIDRVSNFGSAKLELAALVFSTLTFPAHAAGVTKDWKFSGNPGDCIITATFSDKTRILIGHQGGRIGDAYFIHAVNPSWKSSDGDVQGSAIFDDNTNILNSKATIRTVHTGTKFHTLVFREDSKVLNFLSSASGLSLKFGDNIYGFFPLRNIPTPLTQFLKCTGGTTSTTILNNPPPPRTSPPPAPTPEPKTIPQINPPGNLTAKVTQSMKRDINMLILNDSQGWFRNVYIFNSVYKVNITERTDNRNFVVRAWYLFSRSQKGYVDVVVRNGNYNCLRFWDYPKNCKKARLEQL